MNIYEANMFDSRKLNLRLFIDAMKLDKQLTGSYNKSEHSIQTNAIFINNQHIHE